MEMGFPRGKKKWQIWSFSPGWTIFTACKLLSSKCDRFGLFSPGRTKFTCKLLRCYIFSCNKCFWVPPSVVLPFPKLSKPPRYALSLWQATQFFTVRCVITDQFLRWDYESHLKKVHPTTYGCDLFVVALGVTWLGNKPGWPEPG
jgi:hypothetical protein